MTKEEWLRYNAELNSQVERWPPPEGKVLLCHITTFAFTSLGVIFSEREYQAFADPNDTRPKKWYVSDYDKVLTIQPQLPEYLGVRI